MMYNSINYKFSKKRGLLQMTSLEFKTIFDHYFQDEHDFTSAFLSQFYSPYTTLKLSFNFRGTIKSMVKKCVSSSTNVNAKLILGYCFLCGFGVKQSIENASLIFKDIIKHHDEKSFSQAYTYALLELGKILRDGPNGDLELGLTYINQSITLNNSDAMYERAYMFAEGVHSPVDKVQSDLLIEKSAALGNHKAQSMLGDRNWMDRANRPHSLYQAIQCFEQARRGGCFENEVDILSILSGYPELSENAGELLDLVWEELLEGKYFLIQTLDFLAKNCQPLILARLEKLPADKQEELKKQLIEDGCHSLNVLNSFLKDDSLIHTIGMSRKDYLKKKIDFKKPSKYTTTGRISIFYDKYFKTPNEDQVSTDNCTNSYSH